MLLRVTLRRDTRYAFAMIRAGAFYAPVTLRHARYYAATLR